MFWVEKGACFVLIRRHRGHACSRESILAGSERQLSYPASSNRRSHGRMADSAGSRNTTGAFQTWEIRFPGSPVLKQEAPLVFSGVCLVLRSMQRKVGSGTEEINGSELKCALFEVCVDEPLLQISSFSVCFKLKLSSLWRLVVPRFSGETNPVQEFTMRAPRAERVTF